MKNTYKLPAHLFDLVNTPEKKCRAEKIIEEGRESFLKKERKEREHSLRY